MVVWSPPGAAVSICVPIVHTYIVRIDAGTVGAVGPGGRFEITPAAGEHSGLGVSSLPLDSAIRVRFPGVARGIAAPWPLGTA